MNELYPTEQMNEELLVGSPVQSRFCSSGTKTVIHFSFWVMVSTGGRWCYYYHSYFGLACSFFVSISASVTGVFAVGEGVAVMGDFIIGN
jgi:hypothetical protein